MACEQDIIVGIDFGTTFSGPSFQKVHNLSSRPIVDSDFTGIAFIIPPYDRVDNPSKEIQIFQSWEAEKGSDKTPSILAYSEESPSLPLSPWKLQTLAQPAESLSWFKLLLDEELDIENWIREVQGWASSRGIFYIPEGMTALQVITDFLGCLRDALWKSLRTAVNTSEVNFDTTHIQFWFTVPVSWSDTTRALMREAIRNAGFSTRDGDEVHLLTEPQAAMTFALADKSLFLVCIISWPKPNLYSSIILIEPQMYWQVGDGVIICDCGGGTVVSLLSVLGPSI